MNIALRLVNSLLLVAILATLLLIWRGMPPTMADLKVAKGDARKALLMRRPYIKTESEITGDVSISNFEPIAVRIAD